MLQALANGIVGGLGYALIASAFGLSVSTDRFFNMVVPAFFSAAAYAAAVVVVRTGSLALSGCAAIVLGVVGALALERLCLAPARDRGRSGDELFTISLGLMLALQAGLALGFGSESTRLAAPDLSSIAIGPVFLSRQQVARVAIGLAGLLVYWWLLFHSSLGRAARALAEDRIRARLAGVEPVRTSLAMAALGGGMNGLAAWLFALDYGVTPQSGFRPFLYAVTGLVLGGSLHGSAPIVGCLVTSVAGALTAQAFGTAWEDAAVFGLLLLLIGLRPRGLLMRR